MGFFRTKSIDRKLPKVHFAPSQGKCIVNRQNQLFTCPTLQRKIEDWKKSDVYKWLSVLQMSKYEEAFKSVSGKACRQTPDTSQLQCESKSKSLLFCLQRVLQLSAADVYRFAENKQDADVLLESIQSLRETGVGVHHGLTCPVAC